MAEHCGPRGGSAVHYVPSNARDLFVQIRTLKDRMRKILTIIRDLLKKNPERMPKQAIPLKMTEVGPADGITASAVWFGHSTVLLELQGKRLLLDPMFANSPSPFAIIGGKRFSRRLPVEPEKLLPVDVVVISHDHYDHLDYQSIQRIKEKTGYFCVPFGVGSRLEKWGVDKKKIIELKWWQETIVDGLRIACTPSVHFSGRGLFDRNKTLWCSWVIMAETAKVFFSGDGGYGTHFADIGKKYGPFDLTLMECGQYDPRWSAIHMLPEESVQAHLDVQGNLMLPIHWAAFSLAFHKWTDPIERAVKSAKEKNIKLTTPQIGERVIIGIAGYPQSVWWK